MRPRCSVACVASSSPPHVCRANIAAVYLQRETTLTARVTWPNTAATFTLINQLWEDGTKKKGCKQHVFTQECSPTMCAKKAAVQKHTHTRTWPVSCFLADRQTPTQMYQSVHQSQPPTFPNKNRYVYCTRQISLAASLARTALNRMARCDHYCGTRFTSGHKK